MTNYKEIVTKAVISKGKKLFTSNHSVEANNPSTILGCWVINHNFNGKIVDNKIVIDGSYDVNIWYSSDNDTKTEVVTDINTYHEVVNMREHEEVDDEEIIVRSLKQPICVKAEIENNTINYTIEKENSSNNKLPVCKTSSSISLKFIITPLKLMHIINHLFNKVK